MPPTPTEYRLKIMLAYAEARALGYTGLAAGYLRLLQLELSTK